MTSVKFWAYQCSACNGSNPFALAKLSKNCRQFALSLQYSGAALAVGCKDVLSIREMMRVCGGSPLKLNSSSGKTSLRALVSDLNLTNGPSPCFFRISMIMERMVSTLLYFRRLPTNFERICAGAIFSHWLGSIGSNFINSAYVQKNSLHLLLSDHWPCTFIPVFGISGAW